MENARKNSPKDDFEAGCVGDINNLIRTETGYLAQNYAPLPMVVTRALGNHIWRQEEDGSEVCMLDALSCYGAVNFGHLNPRIVEALHSQTQRPPENLVSLFERAVPGRKLTAEMKKAAMGLDSVSRGIVNNKLGPFAEALCNITGMDKVLPSSGGAEAVETAIKAARRWGYQNKGIADNQAKIIVASNNFHGRTTTIISFSSEESNRAGFGPYAQDAFIHVPFGDIDALKVALQDKNVCAFIVEPIQGEAGIVVPQAGYIKQAHEACKNAGAMFILDEIQSGMGRTGKNFAFQHELDDGVTPDGLILAKALGGGVYPVSAFLASRELMDVYDVDSHGSTFGGNPVAAAVGLEAVRILAEGNMSQNSAAMGQYLMDGLRDLQKRGILTDVRGRGLWVGMELNPDIADPKSFCKSMAFDQHVFSKYAHEQYIRLAPPLTCGPYEIDYLVEAVYNTAVKYRPSLRSIPGFSLDNGLWFS